MNRQRAAVGLPPLRDQWFHALRHQAGTFQYAMGARDREVAAFLRHAPGSKVTQRYIHLSAEFRRRLPTGWTRCSRSRVAPNPTRK